MTTDAVCYPCFTNRGSQMCRFVKSYNVKSSKKTRECEAVMKINIADVNQIKQSHSNGVLMPLVYNRNNVMHGILTFSWVSNLLTGEKSN